MSLTYGCHQVQLNVLDGRDESLACGRCACEISEKPFKSGGSEEDDDEDELVYNTEQKETGCMVRKRSPRVQKKPGRERQEHHRGELRQKR